MDTATLAGDDSMPWTDPDTIVETMEDRTDEWLDVLQEFIRTPSENPPGGTRDVASYLTNVLDTYEIEYEVIAPQAEMPNVVASFVGSGGEPADGPHLTFNGHLDTYPVGELDRWDRDPFSGAIEDGKIHGRGASDMHGGFVATLAAFIYLFEHRDALTGRVSLAAVSDEETGGQWGTEYLVTNHAEYTGDAVLNGEPSAGFVRFAERGPVWFDVRVRGESAHSAYPHGSNAIETLIDFLSAIRTDPGLAELSAVPDTVRDAIETGREEVDDRFGAGSTDFVLAPSVNIGTIAGGEKINLTPETARAEVDVRLPVGSSTTEAIRWAKDIADAQSDEITLDVLSRTDPTYTDPSHPLIQSLRRWAGHVQDRDDPPPYGCGFGFTDCRFYRERGIPSAYYGPTPYNMGSQNEHITVDDFTESVAVHTLVAVDFMTNHPT